ncbi:MAG TPA: hypothetical protein VIH90_04820 [Candidatus Saccharimonadales bacterium]
MASTPEFRIAILASGGGTTFEVTNEMKSEWGNLGTVDILRNEVMRVEKLRVPNWIHMAPEQL